MEKIQMGTVISGTLRNEDLLNAFIDELEWLRESSPEQIPTHMKLKQDAKVIQTDLTIGYRYGDVFLSEIVNELQDALNEYAPDGMYFGTLEGDGADFGWWNIEMDN